MHTVWHWVCNDQDFGHKCRKCFSRRMRHDIENSCALKMNRLTCGPAKPMLGDKNCKKLWGSSKCDIS